MSKAKKNNIAHRQYAQAAVFASTAFRTRPVSMVTVYDGSIFAARLIPSIMLTVVVTVADMGDASERIGVAVLVNVGTRCKLAAVFGGLLIMLDSLYLDWLNSVPLGESLANFLSESLREKITRPAMT